MESVMWKGEEADHCHLDCNFHCFWFDCHLMEAAWLVSQMMEDLAWCLTAGKEASEAAFAVVVVELFEVLAAAFEES